MDKLFIGKLKIKNLLRDRPHVDCYNFHHYAEDRHLSYGEDRKCPPLGRWNAAMDALEDWVKEMEEHGD